MRPTTRSWASDLRRPLPLAAVAVLAFNDHVLKGSGLLPGWITGKLSDVAGLFFFPILLVALARGTHCLLRGRDIADKRSLAAASVIVTGAVFTLLKLHAPFNAWVTSVWGVNVMDPTDLCALPVVPLAAAFMLRSTPTLAAASSRARPFLDYAAVVAAGIASIATSKAPEPAVPPRPRPAIAVATEGCASLRVQTCERSANLSYVVIETTSTGMEACPITITSALEVAASGRETAADMLPAPVTASSGRASTFALSFPRPVLPAEQAGSVLVRLSIDEGRGMSTVELSGACRPR
ncbi:Hypothetical protein A7982_06107 [Minicystis rosea]|nr:Hypothetical protein A7982_06107 [Minicystis rosea]